jgi:BBSome-interacting protein 1
MSEEEKVSSFKEYIPHKGFLHHKDIPEYILCKPKLMPLKSVTLEKLENMQKEAMEKLKKQQKNEQRS